MVWSFGSAAIALAGTQARITAASGKADKYFLLAIPRGLKLGGAAFSAFRDQSPSGRIPPPSAGGKSMLAGGFCRPPTSNPRAPQVLPPRRGPCLAASRAHPSG